MKSHTLTGLALLTLTLGSCASTTNSPSSIPTTPVIGLHKPGWGTWRPLSPRQNDSALEAGRPLDQLNYGDIRKPGYGPAR